jgi:hypothetical protein
MEYNMIVYDNDDNETHYSHLTVSYFTKVCGTEFDLCVKVVFIEHVHINIKTFV